MAGFVYPAVVVAHPGWLLITAIKVIRKTIMEAKAREV